MLLVSTSAAHAWSNGKKDADRPKLPYNMMGLARDEIDAYDSKAEPVADATAALVSLDNKSWDLIHKYYPKLGRDSSDSHASVQVEEGRFSSNFLSEDATNSPIPFLAAVWSLPEAELSGGLKALHDEVNAAMVLDDYSKWPLNRLRDAVDEMTDAAKTAQGVKYRRSKSKLSFGESLRLYVMTVELLRMETKWKDKADAPPPDMADFSNRLGHQLPARIADGETFSLFLYRPGVLNHPLSKDESEERADVVMMKRSGSSFQVEQFPVYLTANQKEWSPAWIQPKDEQSDTTLIARKFEHDWTRLDGPYIWYWPDQLNGEVAYRATLSFSSGAINIQAERTILSRGAVKRVDRPRDYNPALMSAFHAESDIPAQPTLPADPVSLEEQVNGLKSLRYFSSAFRAWCAYGTSTTGLAPDGHTWVTVLPDPPDDVSSQSGKAQVPQPGSTAKMPPAN